MGISTVQIVLLVIFGCIAGMGSVLDSFQTHRPLIACTVVGFILGDVKTGILHKCKIQSRNVRQINGLHFGFLLF